MRPSGRPGELFEAFSRLTAGAFADDRLLACPTLAKTPHSGDILGRFLRGDPYPALGPAGRLRLALRYGLSNGGHFCFLILTRLFLVLLGWKAPVLGAASPERKSGKGGAGRSPLEQNTAQAPLVILDSFALLPEMAGNGCFRDGYLPGLEAALRQNGFQPVRLYRLYGSRNPRVLWKALKVLAAAGPGLIEAHLFSALDWLRLIRHCFAYPPALGRLIRSLERFACATPEAWIRGALILTSGQNILSGEARRLAGLRLGEALASRPLENPPARIISWYENQTVDKAFQRGLAQAELLTGRHIPTLGAQLFIWPDTLLNNHPDDGEAALGLAPDKILVNGPFFLPEKTRQNYALGPSLRYGHLFGPAACEYSDASRPSDSGRPLLVLLSYHPQETRRVLQLVLPLARQGRELIYKFHPASRIADFASLLPSSPTLISGALMAALGKAGAVIGAGSGSLAEAAALGLPVLNVEDPSGIPGLAYLPGSYQGRLWESVLRSADLEPALARLRAFRQEPAWAEAVRAFRDLLFREPTPETVREAFFPPC
ncbi:MAG: hypothetical protein LBJ82_02290 [Deltaproteobacteria bacterium]|jgi:hypothetical protein|nr:hypothetical protein [Deltaproteobacteria bacterium]